MSKRFKKNVAPKRKVVGKTNIRGFLEGISQEELRKQDLEELANEYARSGEAEANLVKMVRNKEISKAIFTDGEGNYSYAYFPSDDTAATNANSAFMRWLKRKLKGDLYFVDIEPATIEDIEYISPYFYSLQVDETHLKGHESFIRRKWMKRQLGEQEKNLGLEPKAFNRIKGWKKKQIITMEEFRKFERLPEKERLKFAYDKEKNPKGYDHRVVKSKDWIQLESLGLDPWYFRKMVKGQVSIPEMEEYFQLKVYKSGKNMNPFDVYL